MNEVRTSNKHRQEHSETTGKKQGHNGTNGNKGDQMSTWKERIEQGKPTKLDLLISAVYSQILIIQHNFRVKPLKTAFGVAMIGLSLSFMLVVGIEKPIFGLSYLLFFVVWFLLGKKGKKNVD